MSTEIVTTLVSIRRCASRLGIGENYLRAIVRNEPEIKVRHIGGCKAVSYPQVKRFLQSRNVQLGRPYETRKSQLRIVTKPAVNE
jgi:hypothetical protein